MRNYFTYGGKSSKDYGVYISGLNTYNGAERDIESVSIPGRNGDLHIDNGRYKNVKMTYPAFIYDNFDANVTALRNLLLSSRGYQRLEDTYHPGEFRRAVYSGSFDADVVDYLGAGQFDIVFDCAPQRFLKSGEKTHTYTSGGVIRNETDQIALPLIRAYGDGTLTIGDISITISGSSSYTDIDCELQEAYKDTLATNKNSTITLTDGKFFELLSGVNNISFTGISKIEITPRWWVV